MKPVQQEELLDNIYRVLSHGAVGTDVAESLRTRVHEPTAPAVAERSSRRLSVLVAEDNKFNQKVIQRMLERRGHTVRVVSNGSETLAALEQSAIDLVLLDVNMPELDGFEVIKIIRGREKTGGKHLHVIALTALSGKRDRERCIDAGMDDFLAKPVRAAEVYAMLERVTAAQSTEEPEPAATRFDRPRDLVKWLRWGCGPAGRNDSTVRRGGARTSRASRSRRAIFR
jgi:CheY-like chemotaxis protein